MSAIEAAELTLECIQACVTLPKACHTFVSTGVTPAHESSSFLYVGVSNIFSTTKPGFPADLPLGQKGCNSVEAATLELVYAHCIPTTDAKGRTVSDATVTKNSKEFYEIADKIRMALPGCLQDPDTCAKTYIFQTQTFSVEADSAITRIRFTVLLPAVCFACDETP